MPRGLTDVEVLWLGDAAATDPRRVGGKAANLSRLASDWPVPPGFCLPAEISKHLLGADRQPSARSLRRLVRPAYRKLCAAAGRRRLPVAVRSSAVGEDSAEASFAGQHDTVLNAVGVRAIADAVNHCCRSAASETARAYRAAHDLDAPPRMAVLVQQLVDADVAAVIFSVNPVTADRDEIVINASWGLGQAVVDGAVTPDTYVVSRETLALASRHVGDKDIEVVRTRRGTREVAVPASRRSAAALTESQCRQLGRLAVDLEERMGWPVDLECAYEDGDLFLLQCRPITSLPTS